MEDNTSLARVRLAVLLAVSTGLAAAPGALATAAVICTPRVGEKLGVRFVEVCAASAEEVLGEAGDQVLPAFWIAAMPVPCSQGDHDPVHCPLVTPLDASAVGSRLRNHAMRAAVVDAATAHRTCTLRFGGRLPTVEERQQARHVLAHVSLLVREDQQASGRLHFDELADWVGTPSCVDTPSTLGPDCRVTAWPPVITRPRRADDRALACDADIADFGREPPVRLGDSCDATTRHRTLHPHCALVVTDTATPARFLLRCRESPPLREGAAAPSDTGAAFRCVVPRSALGRLGEPTLQRRPPRAPDPSP